MLKSFHLLCDKVSGYILFTTLRSDFLEFISQSSSCSSSTSSSTSKDKNAQANSEWLLNSPNGSKTPLLRFKCSALGEPPEDPPAKQLHMTYKIFQVDTKLINVLLQAHGFTEVTRYMAHLNSCECDVF
uniref:Uncharacterized protein n=1 Tax=Trichogramma kaykai TaxID=54128 RepID=A0ABD2XG84_9HYME